MIHENKRVEAIQNSVQEKFPSVFDGPAHAYFEMPNSQGGIARGIYKVWAMYVTDSSLVPELFEKLELHLDALRERGGVMFVWRRYPTFEIDDLRNHRLSARFTVLDVHLDDVPWPEYTECVDGVSTRLLAS